MQADTKFSGAEVRCVGMADAQRQIAAEKGVLILMLRQLRHRVSSTVFISMPISMSV
jgi:hypothetical protein